MHILHAVRDLDRTSGGIARSVPELARALATVPSGPQVTTLFQFRGAETTVGWVDVGQWATEARAGGAACVAVTPANRRLAISCYLRGIQQIHAHAPVDFIHIHGLWSPVLAAVARFAKKNNIPYAVSPRGMLSSWALKHRSFRKRLAWYGYQRSILQNACAIHVTSDQEKNDVLRHVPRANTVVVPNGCVCTQVVREDMGLHTLDLHDVRWCVALGRIHPIKGLDRLLKAWAAVRPNHWKLAIVGPDEGGHKEELIGMVREFSLESSVKFLGAVEPDRSREVLAQASLFVQASHSENFGFAIAEALSVGVPVIASRGTPWAVLQEAGAGWWVANDVESLSDALRQATQGSSEELRTKGEAGRELIRSRFSWEEMARRMERVYREFILSDLTPSLPTC